MSRKITCHLVVGVDGSVRAVKGMPRPSPSDVVVRLDLTLPTPPRIAAVLKIDLPEPPDANVEAIVAQWGPVEDPGEKPE